MGKLIQVATNTVTSVVASVTLTGIDSDDVYMVTYSGYTPTVDSQLRIRFTVSGSADTSANYDFAYKTLIASQAFSNASATNQTYFYSVFIGTATNSMTNGILYLYNFNNASEYSFATIEDTGINSAGNLQSPQGGMVLTVAQACDGIQFFNDNGNIEAGTFTLYKVV